MTPQEILEEHPKGIEYAHLLSEFNRYPIIKDSNDEVASMPPIINGALTTITEDTTDVLIAANSSLDLTKTYVNIDNDGDGLISAGDQLVYTFRLENDGNITQNFIFITDQI